MTARSKEKKHQITIVSGVCGLSVYLNGYRIAGDKPWGGGTTVKHWETVDDADVRTALKKRTNAARTKSGSTSPAVPRPSSARTERPA